jgi:hypothetical protein
MRQLLTLALLVALLLWLLRYRLAHWWFQRLVDRGHMLTSVSAAGARRGYFILGTVPGHRLVVWMLRVLIWLGWEPDHLDEGRADE